MSSRRHNSGFLRDLNSGQRNFSVAFHKLARGYKGGIPQVKQAILKNGNFLLGKMILHREQVYFARQRGIIYNLSQAYMRVI